MKWLEFSQEVPSELVEPVAYLFGRYGRGMAIEEEPNSRQVTLRTYLPATSTWRRARIEMGVRLIGKVRPVGELQVRGLEEADWERAWKAHFTLLRVGERLVIKPSWIHYQPSEGEVVVELDPGMAFGTGHHPTTRMCLEALEELVQPGMRVLDLGAGSGILTIAALRLGASEAVALDVDPLAVKAARQNIRASGLRGMVRLARGSLPHALAEDGFDLVAANINALVIKERAPHLFRALRPGGVLIASGILEEQGQDVEEALKGLAFSLLGGRCQEDWVTLVARREA